MKLNKLVSFAIMAGRKPLGAPCGVDVVLEKGVASFYQAHGRLPILVLVPRELRPGEVLSWSAYPVLTDRLETRWLNTLSGLGVVKNQAEEGGLKRAKNPCGPKSGVRRHVCREGRLSATTPGVDQEICRLSQEGLGIRAIAGVLRGRGVEVSPRTISRRLAVHQGKLPR
ncbi:MAG: hypothetical protein KJ624_02240 [Chloroflexi bacterium]|nr:hypothetical protein [Chloroflexota bacterium]